LERSLASAKISFLSNNDNKTKVMEIYIIEILCSAEGNVISLLNLTTKPRLRNTYWTLTGLTVQFITASYEAPLRSY
jgi:hypothetical protein